jgi:energy-coupling factor transport system substrate-specific component
MNTNKLRAKDLITTAIFTVVFLVVVFACSMTIGMIPLGYPFLVAVAMIPGGIVWAYLRVKVPKRFCVLIQGVVVGLLFMLLGSGWFIAVGSAVGGVVAELISAAGNYKSNKINIISYAAYGISLNMGAFAIVLLARDYYYNFAIQGGMDTAWMDTFTRFMNWPILALTSALCVVGAVIGMALGKAMLKKHFVKAGIV